MRGWKKIILIVMMLGAGREAMGDGVKAKAKGATTNPITLREEAIKDVEERVKGLPMLGEFGIEQVMQLCVEREQLVLQTKMRAFEGPGQIKVKEMGGVTTIGVPEGGFQMVHDDLNRAGAIQVKTTVMMLPQYLQIAQDQVTGTEESSVQLVQSHLGAGGMGNIILYIQKHSLLGAQQFNLKLAAANFEELRWKYPREMDEYFRPIVRDLRQERNVFGVDAKIAWQVFADQWKPDEPMRRKVLALVEKLNADNFQEREKAAETLEKWGYPAAVVLIKMDRSKLSDEQNSRIETILAPYRRLSEEQAGRLRVNVNFLLDCLGQSEEEVIRGAALEQLQKVVGRAVEFDVKGSAEKRGEAVEKLRGELVAAEKLIPSTGRSAASK